jgi:dephospho-CoA kinase
MTKKVIGITGGIGSGKSFICTLLSCYGIPVYNSDNRAKFLLNNSSSLREGIIHIFGDEAYKDNLYNTSFISSKVFTDPILLKQINALVHPAVENDFIVWKNNQNHPLIVKETALLFQDSIIKTVDFSILVYASEELRIERILKRDPQRSIENIKNILDKQGNQEILVKKADFVIYNDNSQSLLKQLTRLFKTVDYTPRYS